MSTLLNQTVDAAFPDCPNVGGVGFHVTMGVGDVGGYIAHDLEVSHDVFNVRFMFCPRDMAGGRVLLLAGISELDSEALRVSYDATSDALAVSTPSGVELHAGIDSLIAWHAVELGIDVLAGQATLWINGVLADQSIGDLTSSAVQIFYLGAIQKDTDLAGEFYLDELCISDAYIGPVAVEPSTSRLPIPPRWLVVYNSADQDAGAWVEHYRQQRGVPFANMAGLNLPTTENIDASQYTDMIDKIESYVEDNGLGGQIMGILLGYRVPGYVDFTGNGPLEAIPSLIQTSAVTAGTLPNPHSSQPTDQRLTYEDMNGIRMTARMDGADVVSTAQLIDRAHVVASNGLDADNSAVYFDPFVGDEPTYQPAFSAMLDWATGLGGMKTRLPIKLSGDPLGNEESSFINVTDDGIFWGWSTTLQDPEVFNSPIGRRAVCAQLYLSGASATSLRNMPPSNWVDVPIDAGYASVIASSRDNPVASIPSAGAFFDAMREGWTLAEAWHVAQPVLRSGFYLVGDLLMTVKMPRHGYEVFGPLGDVEDLDPSSPTYVLPSTNTGLDLTDNAPDEGTSGHYVVRRTDEHGRAESSNTSIRMTNLGGVAISPVLMPSWPESADWPVFMEVGMARVMASWPERLQSTAIILIELLGQAEGQAEVIAATPSWRPLDNYVLAMLSRPPVKTRYRWRLTSIDGAIQHTAYSAWIEPPVPPTLTLQQIGA